jgi:hypothetical protein
VISFLWLATITFITLVARLSKAILRIIDLGERLSITPPGCGSLRQAAPNK